MAVRRDLREYLLEAEFTVRQGEIMVLIGENGSGKSSLLHLIAGLLPPGSGHVKIGEQVLYDSMNGIHVPPEYREIGLVF
ncbi:MAG TPA: ATP-binding cassette domain-containing protein, partial [Methanoregulaceae archaeon]|nr:ATP-binding cassette domain-containing protein [Methanoregulaceae archaeon]